MGNETTNPATNVVVGIGEALFDCFSHGAVLGGAPVNLAVHAHRLLNRIGGKGVVVSARGDDPLGDQLSQELTSRGLTVDHLQTISDYPTGTVQVTVDQSGHPEYEITENVAWDFIDFDERAGQLSRSCSAVCFGTLAQRSDVSRAAVHSFLASAPDSWRLCDLNLRQQFYSEEIIRQSFEAANAMKLSEEELEIAAEILGCVSNEPSEQATQLYNQFDLKLLAVTRGSRGTLLYRDGQRYEAEVPRFPAADQADSVGAGDACSAAIVTGLLLQWPTEKIVELANLVGAYVASQAGATPNLPPEILAAVSAAN